MKKIIYSLVIMIAAGSLFTSCIEPVEPAGIYDLREAKARYYDALSKLRAADALLVEAQADHEKANAEFRRAQVENQNLLNEAQRLANEAQALGNEQEAARWAMRIEELKKQHELNMIDYETAIAQAKEAQRQALSEIAMAALDLTEAEKGALAKAIREYERAYANYLDALEDVADAEAALWEAQYAFDNATDTEGIYTDYYGDYIAVGEDLVEYYEDCVAYYSLYAAYYAALYEEWAENSDAAEWAEELEELKAELAERQYNRYQVTKDSVEYMQNIFHDGNIEFGLEVAAWKEANPAVAEPAKPVEPKESSYKAEDYEADSIAFPVYKYNVENAADAKLISLLSSYYKLRAPLGVDSTSYVIDTAGKKIVINANQTMKDFVMGTAASSVETQELKFKKNGKDTTYVADYGLNGALSVLKRELVIKKGVIKTKEDLEKDLKEKKENWEKDNKILADFYAAVAAKEKDSKAANPFATYEPIAKAKAAYEQAVKDDAAGNTGLANAAQSLIDKLNGIVGHNDYSTPDSTALVDAIVAFATAREKYLPYTAYKNSPIDSNKFYYVYATAPKALVDSSLTFKDLTMTLLREKAMFSYAWANIPTKPETASADLNAGGHEGAFINIFNQLIGTAVGAIVEAETGTVTPAMLNSGNTFYKTYEFVPATAEEAAYMKDKVTGEKVVNADVAKAKAALEKAINQFNKVFVAYWGVNPGVTFEEVMGGAIAKFQTKTPTGAYAKYNPAVYTVESFTKPFNVVNFNEGKQVIWTAAIGAILGSVDPNATDANATNLQSADKKTVDGTKSAIFAGNATDFYKYMYAAWALENEDLEAAIEKIEKWIGEVEAAFVKDVTDAEAAAKKAYDKAKSDYDKAVKTYDTNKKKYDDYMTALKAFVGVDAKGNPINVSKNAAGAYVPNVTSIQAPYNYVSAQVKQTQTGAFTWEGEWRLGGTQKELAEKYMPKFPEKLAGWRSAAKDNEDKIGHLEEIINVVEDALMASIGVAEGVPAWVIEYVCENVEGYYQYILDYLQEEIEYGLAMVSEYTKALERAEAGYDPAQLAIMVLEDNLAYAEQVLADAEVKLAVAQAYYEKVLAAIAGKN